MMWTTWLYILINILTVHTAYHFSRQVPQLDVVSIPMRMYRQSHKHRRPSLMGNKITEIAEFKFEFLNKSNCFINNYIQTNKKVKNPKNLNLLNMRKVLSYNNTINEITVTCAFDYMHIHIYIYV